MNDWLFKNFRRDDGVDVGGAHFDIDPVVWREYYRQRKDVIKALYEGRYVWVGNWKPLSEPLNVELMNEIRNIVCTNSYVCKEAYNEDGNRLEFVMSPWCGEDNYAIYAHLKPETPEEDNDDEDEDEEEDL